MQSHDGRKRVLSAGGSGSAGLKAAWREQGLVDDGIARAGEWAVPGQDGWTPKTAIPLGAASSALLLGCNGGWP